MELKNKRWTDEEFLAERPSVLAQWPTGREVDLAEGVEYQRRLPENKCLAKVLAKAHKEGRILVDLRFGRPRIEDMVDEVITLKPYADTYDIDVDTYTRKGLFARAQEGMEKSYKEGKDLINGYPYVCQGMKNTRKMVDASDIPLCCASNDEDPRLMDEIATAAGLTSNLVHDVRELMAHTKNYDLAKRLRNNQYCCKLAAYYTERGAPICSRPAGSNLPFSPPPGMGITLIILECLTMAVQGVKHILLSYDQHGEIMQDIASFHVVKKMAAKYLARFGYGDIPLYVRAAPGAYAWPRDKDASGSQVGLCTVTAVLAGVDLIRTKSTDEGRGTPSVESQITAGKIAKHVVNVLGKRRLTDSTELLEEERMQELEVCATLDKILELGDGDTCVGQEKAVEQGVIDIPFSPWIRIKGAVMSVRDPMGAVRYLDPGNVPLPKEVVEYHRRMVAEREAIEKRQAGLDMLIEDLGFRTKSVATKR